MKIKHYNLLLVILGMSQQFFSFYSYSSLYIGSNFLYAILVLIFSTVKAYGLGHNILKVIGYFFISISSFIVGIIFMMLVIKM